MNKAATLLGAILLGLGGLAFQPASAQEDIFRPSEAPSQEERPKPDKPDKPAPDNTASLAGTWTADSSGNSMCASNMTVKVGANLSGTIDNKGYIGRFTAERRGDTVALHNSYTDVFGNAQIELWQGTVLPDGRSITGVIHGSWADGCRFEMRKR